MPKVTIHSYTVEDNGWNGGEEATVVYVDGVNLGTYTYGGEPEDNLRRRDYRWVEDLLKKLANQLGAETKIVSIQKDEEFDLWEDVPSILWEDADPVEFNSEESNG